MTFSLRTPPRLFPILFLQGCLSQTPLAPKAVALQHEASVAFASGDRVTARAKLTLALEYHPRFTEAWVNLANLELQAGNFELALEYGRRARELNPNLPAVHHMLGLVEETRGNWADAEHHYEAALDVDPGMVPARVNLARLLFRRGELEYSAAAFLQAALLAPDNAEAWAGRVESLLRIGRHADADRALASIPQATSGSPAVTLLRARAAMRLGSLTEAQSLFEAVARSMDRKRAAEACAWLALVFHAQGDSRKARMALDKARALDPQSDTLRFTTRTLYSPGSRPDVDTRIVAPQK